jgi:hypothetical protein
MTIQEAIELIQAAGYRVSRPRKVKPTISALNAIGKPYSPQYDPNYRMKYHTPPLKRTQNIGHGISPAQWAEMCKLAQAQWNNDQARQANIDD